MLRPAAVGSSQGLGLGVGLRSVLGVGGWRRAGPRRHAATASQVVGGHLKSDDMSIRVAYMGIVLLTIAIAPPARAAAITAGTSSASCTTEHEDDAKTASCFGWCSPAFAESHCSQCKCRGCPWCASSGTATTLAGSQSMAPIAAPAAAEAEATESAACTSEIADDAHFKDCQPFCSAAYRDDHCQSCKCKACSFCACTSEVEGDVSEEMCQGWCSEEFADDHCAVCKCKGCGFCRVGQACTPADEHDSTTAECDSFCSAEFAESHCQQCKCKRCGFCKGGGSTSKGSSALALPAGASSTEPGSTPAAGGLMLGVLHLPIGATCTSDAKIGVWDSEVATCEAFCDEEQRSSHCQLCKCRGCELCKCHSQTEGDSSNEICEEWCSPYFWTSHCDMCKCKGCGFCLEGVPCAPADADDAEIERCEPFCSKLFATAHWYTRPPYPLPPPYPLTHRTRCLLARVHR